MSDRIAWIDCETTGLDPLRDRLLEVACQITDTDLNLVGGMFHEVVYCPESRVAAIRGKADPVVQAMHDRTGLWNRLPEGIPIVQVQHELLHHIRQWAPEPLQARLGGNSVALDAGFLREYLPAVSDHLHYRIVDVTSLAAVADWWFGCGKFPKVKRHDAVSDIRETIAEARWLRGRLRSELVTTELAGDRDVAAGERRALREWQQERQEPCDDCQWVDDTTIAGEVRTLLGMPCPKHGGPR